MPEDRSLDQTSFIRVFEKLDALLTGHFVLASKPEGSPYRRHSGHYVNKDMASSNPWEVQDFAYCVLDKAGIKKGIDIVVAPAAGAIVFGTLVAQELETRFAYARNEEGKMVFRGGFSSLIRPGKKVLIAEDVVSSGNTLRGMVSAVKELGAEIVGAVLLWQREDIDLGEIPITPLIDKKFPSWEAELCDLCKRASPVNTTVGHGREFLDEFGTDPYGWPANRRTY